MVYRPLRYEQMMRAAEAYDVRARRMFGGMGVYTGEKMFAFLVGEGFGLSLMDVQPICPQSSVVRKIHSRSNSSWRNKRRTQSPK